jgi:hypothetical protein
MEPVPLNPCLLQLSNAGAMTSRKTFCGDSGVSFAASRSVSG